MNHNPYWLWFVISLIVAMAGTVIAIIYDQKSSKISWLGTGIAIAAAVSMFWSLSTSS